MFEKRRELTDVTSHEGNDVDETRTFVLQCRVLNEERGWVVGVAVTRLD